MRVKSAALALCCGLLLCAIPARAGVYYVTVAGLGGEPDYEQEFTSLATDLDRLLKASGSDAHVFTLDGNDATRARLTDVLGKIASQAKPDDDFVLILIGHGTYDGVEYKFNLVGPDISAVDLAALCDRIAAKRQLIVNTTSASGGSVPALEKRGRCVIAATKSGTEKNATVFARYWVEALHDPEADLDKNESVSALEAFQYATKKTAAFYDAQKRLATEHAVFDDTGHHDPVREPASDTGEGLLLSNFTLIRLGAAQKAYNDPAEARIARAKRRPRTENRHFEIPKAGYVAGRL